jgi:hypothetical protein
MPDGGRPAAFFVARIHYAFVIRRRGAMIAMVGAGVAAMGLAFVQDLFAAKSAIGFVAPVREAILGRLGGSVIAMELAGNHGVVRQGRSLRR